MLQTELRAMRNSCVAGLKSGLLFVMLLSCSTDEPVTTTAPALATLPELSSVTAATELRLQTLSTKPWLITGGDVLVELMLPENGNPAALQVSLNGVAITSSFRPVSALRLQALLTDLPLGDSTLQASLGNNSATASLLLTNYPISGPIISGPHETPFYCQTEEFQLVTGALLGPAQDSNCAVVPRVDYIYWSTTDAAFKPWPQFNAGFAPLDLAQISVNGGSAVPYIVRVETGTVNRSVYEIAMLHNPADAQPDPWTRSAQWNGKLVYTHGGGCRGGWYQQGNSTGGVLREGLFAQGYAVVSATFNVFGNNCNDLLASETHIMVKERFIEQHGVPIYTIATGASGGSYQSHQTADNYPGVFDGIIVSSSFPDVTSATIFTLADARLLHYYFTAVNQESFTLEQQRAVAGFGAWGSLPNLSRGAARLDPLYGFDTALEEQGGELSIPALENLRFSNNLPDGVRATVYDHTINVYGTVANTLIAQRPLDNVGVQYGLAALNAGVISPQQFIDLNRDIGGFDREMNHVPERHVADPAASKRAIESGRILFGGAGLASTPVIDYRSYTDHSEDGDIHMIVHQYSTRQRLQLANGHANNHVMQIGGAWGFTADAPDLGELFRQMDQWLLAIASDRTDADQQLKVERNKPARLTDACWDNTAGQHTRINEIQAYTGGSRCSELYPAYPTPRQVAGAPLANAVVSCHLRLINTADYSVEFLDEQFMELRRIFPDGVCDWSAGDATGARYQGTWLSFGPSPINRI